MVTDEGAKPLDDDKAEKLAERVAHEIYQHIENDHVADDIWTYVDLALLMVAIVAIAIVPVWGASFSLFPNIVVKGYQIICRKRRANK